MSAELLPAEIIRAKRDRRTLSAPQIQSFVRGLVDGSWGEGQIAALAMAVLLNGMTRDEAVLLTRAMTYSGQLLCWDEVVRDSGAGLDKPVLDKHSTGGVGDKVSLMLAPIVAACGGLVPMISGRGLGHTGGTLDKLQSLPGYRIDPSRAQLLACLRAAGCAIIGASADLAPADKRLYAIRDVTATVESLPLITASILSKKLAAGLQALVLDVKLGNGAFMTTLPDAQALAHSLVDVAGAAGLPSAALITDMNQPLGRSAGNALEVAEAVAFLTGAEREPRLLKVTLDLSARLLQLGGLARDAVDAMHLAQAALSSGRAAEQFARMVAALGGPRDVLRDAQLPAAPLQRALLAPCDGVLSHVDTRALGLVLVELGGGRRLASDAVDPRVGLSQLLPLGTLVRAGEPLLQLHAASAAAADAAQAALLAALTLAEPGMPKSVAAPVVIDRIDACVDARTDVRKSAS